MTDMTDPRVTEFREALASVSCIGDDGALVPVDPSTLRDGDRAERYRAALAPYCEFHAEITPPIVRDVVASALHETTLIPRNIIRAAFAGDHEAAA